MHICSECKISFGCAELRSHMVTQSKGKAYNCVQCHKSFGQAGHLKMHIATHSNEKTYTCVQCQKSFSITGNMKRHMLTHSGVKTHTCSECGKSFSLAHHLRMHMVTHTGEGVKKNVQNVEIHLVRLGTWNSTCSLTVGRSHTSAHNAIMQVHEQPL